MIELVHSELAETDQQRLTRLRNDIRALYALSPAQLRGVYDQIEIARDMLSTLLDKTDGKFRR